MSDLILQGSGALTISESDRIRIAAAWEALSVNSRRSYQGAWDRCGQWLTDRGISLDDLSDELMAVYIATLDAEGRTPATIAVSVAAVKWTASKSHIDVVGEITQRTLAGIRREGKDRGRGQVEGLILLYP